MHRVMVTFLLPGDVYMNIEEFEHLPRVGEFIRIGQDYRVVQVVHVLVAPTVGPKESLCGVSVEKCSLSHQAFLKPEDEVDD